MFVRVVFVSPVARLLRGVVADDIGLDTLPLHLAQQLQGLLRLRALRAGADRGVVADDIGLDTTPLNLTQLQGLLGLRALHTGAER